MTPTQPRLRFALRLRRPSAAWCVRLAIFAIVVALGCEVLRVTAGPNTHAVVPGKVFRCSQPTVDGLREQIAQHGIRTVINLRGFCPLPKDQWYRDELGVCHAAGVSQEDITLSANALPYPAELRRLIETLDASEYPVLVHCKQGADRTGLVSAMVLLLYSDASVSRARRQLWPRYGHFRVGRTAAMDDFFDRYEASLGDRPHTPATFRNWVLNVYTPGPAVGTLVRIDELPLTVAVGDWLSIPVVATNGSCEAWEFQAGEYAGIHVAFTVQAADGAPVHQGKAGLLRTTIAPGGTIRLALAIPPLPPGGYLVRADLTDATAAGVPVRANGFYKFSVDPLLVHFTVR